MPLSTLLLELFRVEFGLIFNKFNQLLVASEYQHNFYITIMLMVCTFQKCKVKINPNCTTSQYLLLKLNPIREFHKVYVGVSDLEIKRLQRVQNTLARVVLCVPLRTCSSVLLHQLHWLPVEFRIRFKLACLTYKALSTSKPTYLHALLTPYTPSSAIIRHTSVSRATIQNNYGLSCIPLLCPQGMESTSTLSS